MRSRTAFMLRRKSDNKVMPEGGTHANPFAFEYGPMPRLFCTRAGAARALGWWVKGYCWNETVRTISASDFAPDDDVVLRVNPAEGRNKDDWEIVTVSIEELT